MAIILDQNSKIIVQGMTGSEGMKHTQRMLDSGAAVVGGVNPRKAGATVDFNGGTTVPVYGSVKEAVEATGANVSVIFVPAKFTKSAVMEPSSRDAIGGLHHRGCTGQRHRGVLHRCPAFRQDSHHRPELPGHH